MHVYPKLLLKKFKTIQKKFLHPTNIKKICVLNIRMENLWIDELKLTAEHRNISDYENKSKEDLIKALSEPKPKPQTPKPEPKLQTPKPKPKPEPKIEVKVNKKRLEKIRKDFDELRHKFSKKEIKEYRKAS